MDPHVVLADMYIRGSLARSKAFSALPDAPVLPIAERRSHGARVRLAWAAVVSVRRSAVRPRRALPVVDCACS
jgi:hypothetical protein